MYPADVGSVAGAALGIIVIVLLTYMVAVGIGIAMYILQALGLYTIAQRRGIKHPWLAWLPLTNMWILGSISDQYRYVVRGQIRNRRKVLLGLCIAMFVVALALYGLYAVILVDLVMQIPELPEAVYMAPGQIVGPGLSSILWVLVILLVIWVLAVVTTVFQYVCLYDLYASCTPNYRVLFLVLSILFNVTMPFIVFACRKKDGGMPPRKDEVSAAIPDEPVEIVEE